MEVITGKSHAPVASQTARQIRPRSEDLDLPDVRVPAILVVGKNGDLRRGIEGLKGNGKGHIAFPTLSEIAC